MSLDPTANRLSKAAAAYEEAQAKIPPLNPDFPFTPFPSFPFSDFGLLKDPDPYPKTPDTFTQS